MSLASFRRHGVKGQPGEVMQTSARRVEIPSFLFCDILGYSPSFIVFGIEIFVLLNFLYGLTKRKSVFFFFFSFLSF